jgi:hypothetical protein
MRRMPPDAKASAAVGTKSEQLTNAARVSADRSLPSTWMLEESELA